MVGKLTPDDIISASLVPALMGMSPYMSRNELLSRCMAARDGIFEDDFTGNEATHWGNTLEPVILEEAAARLNLTGLNVDFPNPFFHHDLPLACSLDGSATTDGRVRIKTDRGAGIYVIGASEIEHDGPIIIESKLTSGFPEERPPAQRGPLQLQAQMMCTGHTCGVIATLYRGIELRLFVYGQDVQTQDRIRGAVEDFERRREGPDFYPAISSADANVAYSTVDDDAPELDLDESPEVAVALSDLVAAKRAKKAAESEIDICEALIKEYMGAHKRATGRVGNHTYSVTWPMRHYKATPEKYVPAKPERSARQGNLTLKEM